MFLEPGQPASTDRWVTGDHFGLAIPADAAALLDGGPELLTALFRAGGSLDAPGRVVEIAEAREFAGGGTGRKLLLTVRYEHADPALPEELFVKLSRDFDDPLRDRGRSMMVSEVDVALVSRDPDFPVPVPRCLFADIPDVVAAEDRIRAVLTGSLGMVAFAHWNANIDNCWFERQADGTLRCGFIDWANAGPTNVAQSILGAISGAEAHVWHGHLDALLDHYADVFAAQGAPHPDPVELRVHVLLLAALSGLGFSMGAPVAIRREIADVDALSGPHDDAFAVHENARIQLHMMTNLLENWQHFALGDVVRSL